MFLTPSSGWTAELSLHGFGSVFRRRETGRREEGSLIMAEQHGPAGGPVYKVNNKNPECLKVVSYSPQLVTVYEPQCCSKLSLSAETGCFYPIYLASCVRKGERSSPVQPLSLINPLSPHGPSGDRVLLRSPVLKPPLRIPNNQYTDEI